MSVYDDLAIAAKAVLSDHGDVMQKIAQLDGENKQLKTQVAELNEKLAEMNTELLATKQTLADAMKAESELHKVVTGSP